MIAPPVQHIPVPHPVPTCQCQIAQPCQCQIVQPDINVTTGERVSAFAAHNHAFPPAFGQGDVIFMKPLLIQLKQGTQFTRNTIPNIRFTIGVTGTPIQPVNSKVIIPRGTEYIIRNDPIGIIHKTQVDQEFLLEIDTSVTIPQNTIFHIGDEEESFTKDTIVSL